MSMPAATRTAGVLGGMGPFATLAFYQSLLELTPVHKDWDHIRAIIDSNPHIPSRSLYHLGRGPSPVPGMVESCRRLEQYPVDFIVIPCNSASFYLPEVQARVSIPILNIMEITSQALAEQHPSAGNVVVLGGIVTYENRTYEPYLNHAHMNYFHHSLEHQRKAEQLIEMLKANTPLEEAGIHFEHLLDGLQRETSLDAVILGCTEFGLLIERDFGIPVVDSSRELARQTVALAKNI